MLISIQHKATSLPKDGVSSYTYTIQDDNGTKDVSFSMPLFQAIMHNSLATIALHQAYHKQGREVVGKVLNDYYALLKKEGRDDVTARNSDLSFYRKIVNNSSI